MFLQAIWTAVVELDVGNIKTEVVASTYYLGLEWFQLSQYSLVCSCIRQDLPHLNHVMYSYP